MSSILERSLLIDLLLENPNPIIVWFNSICDNLHTIETNIHHTKGGEIVYYIINNLGEAKWIFYQDNNRYFWTSHIRYWHVLTSEFYITPHYEAQSITKILVENVLRRNIASSPNYANYANTTKIENAMRLYNNLNNEHHYD